MANLLGSVDTLRNLHFESNYLFGDLDDCLRPGYVFPLNDASVDLDDCLHGLHTHYLCYSFCECFGCGVLVYFGVCHSAGHLHIHSYFGHHNDHNGYHNVYSDCPVCVYYFHGYVPVHHLIDV